MVKLMILNQNIFVNIANRNFSYNLLNPIIYVFNSLPNLNQLSTSFPFKISNNLKAANNSKKVLIIVPGYSVSIPPRIGDHRYYISALKYHKEKNPFGYKKIYLFDLYSKKANRCHFNFDIPMLAKLLFKAINSDETTWRFTKNCEIDFIGASMGGLIVRKFINDYMIGKNIIRTQKWGGLRINTIVLIATPNFGCSIIDKLQNPIIQFLLKIAYRKNNFSISQQFRQLSSGNTFIFGPFLRKFSAKKTPPNVFLEELNSKIPTPGDIRWITIHGTKKQWFSCLIYKHNVENDGVVEAAHVELNGAENISDKDLQKLWDHRDLYQDKAICNLLFGLLILNLKLDDYLILNQLFKKNSISQDNFLKNIPVLKKAFLDKRLF